MGQERLDSPGGQNSDSGCHQREDPAEKHRKGPVKRVHWAEGQCQAGSQEESSRIDRRDPRRFRFQPNIQCKRGGDRIQGEVGKERKGEGSRPFRSDQMKTNPEVTEEAPSVPHDTQYDEDAEDAGEEVCMREMVRAEVAALQEVAKVFKYETTLASLYRIAATAHYNVGNLLPTDFNLNRRMPKLWHNRIEEKHRKHLWFGKEVHKKKNKGRTEVGEAPKTMVQFAAYKVDIYLEHQSKNRGSERVVSKKKAENKKDGEIWLGNHRGRY